MCFKCFNVHFRLLKSIYVLLLVCYLNKVFMCFKCFNVHFTLLKSIYVHLLVVT